MHRAPPLGAAHFRAAKSAVSVDPETRTSPSSRRAKTAHPRQTLGRRCERRRSWRNVRPTAHAVDHFPRVSDSATVPERGNIRCDVEELCRIAAMHHYVNLIPTARIPPNAENVVERPVGKRRKRAMSFKKVATALAVGLVTVSLACLGGAPLRLQVAAARNRCRSPISPICTAIDPS